MGKSLSLGKGKGSIGHNNRDESTIENQVIQRDENDEIISGHIDSERTHLNRTYKQQSLTEAYEECFGEALRKYNKEQERESRKIDDYYEHLFGKQSKITVASGGNKQNSFYEDLVQIGTMDDTGCGTPDGEAAAAALEEYMAGWQERNPQLHCFNAVLHLDEATPHLHINYIPVATGYKKGLDTQNGLNKAIEQMKGDDGKPKFKTTDKENTAFMQWRESERQALIEICGSRGIEIAEKGETRGHSFRVAEFKEIQEEKKAGYAELADLENKIYERGETVSKLDDKIMDRNDELKKVVELVKPYQTTAEALAEYKPPLTTSVPENMLKPLIKKLDLKGKKGYSLIRTERFDMLIDVIKQTLVKYKEVEQREFAVGDREAVADERGRSLAHRERGAEDKDLELVYREAEIEKREKKVAHLDVVNVKYSEEVNKNNTLSAEISTLRAENNTLRDKIKEQSAEIGSLKAHIADIPNKINKAVAEVKQRAAEALVSVVKAVSTLDHDEGQYKANLTKKQSGLIQAIGTFAERWAKKENLPEAAKTISEKYGIDKEIKQLEPKQQSHEM